MTRYRHAQNNFTSGVLGERLHGRTEIEQYKNGVRKLDGFMPRREGGLFTMPSTHILHVEGVNGIVLPKTPKYPDGGYLCTDGQFFDIRTQVFVAVTHLTASQSPEPQYFKRNYLDGTVFNLSTSDSITTGDVTIVTFTDKSIPPHVIAITDNGVFTAPWGLLPELSEVTPISVSRGYATVAYNNPNTKGGRNITISNTVDTNGWHLCTTSFNLDNSGTYYSGRYLRVELPTQTVFLYVRDKVGSTSFYAEVVVAPSVYPVTSDDWAFATMGGSVGEYYPTAIGTFEDRLFYSGISESYVDVTGSSADNIFLFLDRRMQQADGSFDFTGEAEPYDPIRFSITTDVRTETTMLFGAKTLLIGTREGIYSATGGAEGMTPTSVSVQRIAYMPVAPVQPIGVENEVLICDVNKKIYSLRYSNEGGGYVPSEVTALYTSTRMPKSLTYNSELSLVVVNPEISTTKEDNWSKLEGFVMQRSTGVLAWCTKEFSPILLNSGDNTEYVREWFNSPDGKLSAQLIRYDGAEFTHYIVEMNAEFTGPFDIALGELYVRLELCSKVVYVGVDTQTVVTFPEYANRSVSLVRLEPVTYEVNSISSVTLNASGETTVTGKGLYFVGLQSSARIETLPIVTASAAGSGDAALSRIDRVTPRFIGTTGGKIGTRENYLNTIFSLADAQPFSGPQQISLDCGQELDNVVIIETDEPYPMEISSLVFRGQVFE